MMAIMNGTANFILTKMTDEGKPFPMVLREAQNLGFAEADPTFDIEGIDTAHKLAIVLALAYGRRVDLDAIHVEGITAMNQQDIEFAREFGYRIKLLALAFEREGRVEARIHPTMIPFDHLLANVNSNFNAFHLIGSACGSVFLYGQGAGMMPTASAVVGDLMDISREILKNVSGLLPFRSLREDRMTDIDLVPSMKPIQIIIFPIHGGGPSRCALKDRRHSRRTSHQYCLGHPEGTSRGRTRASGDDYPQSPGAGRPGGFGTNCRSGCGLGENHDHSYRRRETQMKYIVLLGDGMADYPVAELNGRTPLEAARTPNMDRMAGEGLLGLVDTIPAGLKPGSDVANLTVLVMTPPSSIPTAVLWKRPIWGFPLVRTIWPSVVTSSVSARGLIPSWRILPPAISNRV